MRSGLTTTGRISLPPNSSISIRDMSRPRRHSSESLLLFLVRNRAVRCLMTSSKGSKKIALILRRAKDTPLLKLCRPLTLLTLVTSMAATSSRSHPPSNLTSQNTPMIWLKTLFHSWTVQVKAPKYHLIRRKTLPSKELRDSANRLLHKQQKMLAFSVVPIKWVHWDKTSWKQME